MKRYLLLAATLLIASAGLRAQITSFPYNQGFENGLAGWTVFDLNGDGYGWNVADVNDPGDNGAYSFAAHGGTKYLYSGSYMRYAPYNELTPDNLLVSPAITVTPGLVLRFWYRSNGTDGVDYGHEHLSVFISTTGGQPQDFTAIENNPVEDFVCSDEESMSYHSRFVSLAQYQGQTIHIGFRHWDCSAMYEIYLDDIFIGLPMEPELHLPTDAEVNLNTPLTITANYSGATEGLQFQWSSLMEQNGDATLSWNNNVANITYSTAGTDMLRVIATNNYGSDTAYMEIRAIQINPVTEYPFSFGFENYEPTLRYNNGVNGWHVGHATSSAGSHSIYISSDNGLTNSYDIYSPSISYAQRYFQFDNTGTYTYGYDWQCQGEPGFDFLRVVLAPAGTIFEANSLPTGMYTGNGELPNGLSDLGGMLSGQPNWSRKEGTFEVTTPGLYKIVFMWVNDASGGNSPAAAIDNIYLAYTSCYAPTDLTLDSLGADYIAMHWNPGGNEDTWLVTVNDTGFYTVNDPWITISGLAPITSYNIKVATLCTDTDTSLSITATWSTPCIPITTEMMPYTENFDNFAGANCWHFYSYLYDVHNNEYPQLNSYSLSHSSPTALQFSGFNNQPCYAVLPYVQDISRVNFSFWVYSYETNYPIKIGVMTDPLDTNTFTLVQDVYVTRANDWNHIEVPLNNYTGSGRYIAIRTGGWYSDYLIDDITVDMLPLCPRPTDVLVNEVTDNSADLTIVDPAGVDNYMVYYSTTGFTDSINVSDNSVSLTNLRSASTYTVRVYGLCPDGSRTNPTTITFSTLMTAVTLPYSTGFENGEDQSWLTINSPNGWYVGTAANNGGTHALYISGDEGASTNYDNRKPSISYAMRSITVEDTGSYGYAFDWYAKGEAQCDYMRVWFVPGTPDLTDGQLPDNVTNGRTDTPANWIDMGNGEMSSARAWNHVASSMTIHDTGTYSIVIMWRNDQSMGDNPAAIIDNISIRSLTCNAPSDLVIESVTTNTISISWTPSGSESAWSVYKDDNSPIIVRQPRTTLIGLTPATSYRISVASICYAGDTSVTLSQVVNTSMIPAQLPYSTRFEAGDDRQWMIYNATNRWVIGTATSHSGQYSLYVSGDNGATNHYNMLSKSVTYATRLVQIDQIGPLEYSYSWAAQGEVNCDFMRIWLVPGEYVPTENELPTGISAASYYRGSPSGWIELGDGLMNRQILWDVRSGDVVIPDAGLYTLVVMWNNDYTGGGQPAASIDDIHLDYSLCGTPHDLVYDTVGAHSIALHWGRSGSENRWLVTCDNNTLITTDTFAVISPLSAVHHYTISIQSLCDNGDTSQALTGEAITACDIVDLPFTEDFSHLTPQYIVRDNKLPCWEQYTGAFNTMNGTANLTHATSDKFRYSNRSLDSKTHLVTNIYSNDQNWLIMPPINLDAYANLSFHYALTRYNSTLPIAQGLSVDDDRFYVLVSKDGGIKWTPLLKWGTGAGYDFDYATTSATGDSVTVSLSEYAGDTIIIAFYGESYTSGGDNDFHIAHIKVERDPNMPDVCVPPTITDASATTQTATVNFEGTSYSYDVAITTGSWTEPSEPIRVNNNTYTFNRLRANTNYIIGVRSVCDNFASRWRTVNVTTQPPVEVPCETPQNLMLESAELTGASFIWDAVGNEPMWEIEISGAGEQTIISVRTNPASVGGLYANTTYSAKVRARCSATRYSDWSEPTYFTTLSCEPVAMVVVDESTITATQVNLNWTPAPNGSGNYLVEYDLTGFSQGTGHYLMVENATSLTITCLEPNTIYDAYVRSICNDSINSLWSSPVTFETDVQGINNVDDSYMMLHPNPASDCVTLDGLKGETTIQVINLQGSVIETYHAKGSSYTFDVSELPTGSYFVSIIDDKVRAIRKLVVK